VHPINILVPQRKNVCVSMAFRSSWVLWLRVISQDMPPQLFFNSLIMRFFLHFFLLFHWQIFCFFESLSGSGLLGAGRVDEMYPSFGSGRAFSDDGEWRIML